MKDYGTCVKSCPNSKTFTFGASDCKPIPLKGNCNIVTDQGYTTKEIFNICVPSNTDAVGSAVKNQWESIMGNQVASRFWRDIQLCSTAIYISLALGLVYTMMYLYAMSNFAHIIAYIAIAMLELIFVGGMGACLYATTKVQGYGMWITFGSLLFSFLLFNAMMWCYWSKL